MDVCPNKYVNHERRIMKNNDYLYIRLPANLLAEFQSLVGSENTTASEEVRRLIKERLKERVENTLELQ